MKFRFASEKHYAGTANRIPSGFRGCRRMKLISTAWRAGKMGLCWLPFASPKRKFRFRRSSPGSDETHLRDFVRGFSFPLASVSVAPAQGRRLLRIGDRLKGGRLASNSEDCVRPHWPLLFPSDRDLFDKLAWLSGSSSRNTDIDRSRTVFFLGPAAETAKKALLRLDTNLLQR